MKIIANRNGFTFITALMMVVIMGIMLGMVGKSWRLSKQRELEEEMIFRGDQVADLVYQRLLCKKANLEQESVNQFLWQIDSPKGTVLDDLVIGKEERCLDGTTRQFRLRHSAILDPMTGRQWLIVKPVGDVDRFAGVMSDSSEKPLRQKFTSLYDSQLLDDKKHYDEWQFTWELKKFTPQNKIIAR